MAFEVRSVPFNPDGWGPPDSPSSLPFSPPFSSSSFSRFDKLGRIADWTRNPPPSSSPSPRPGSLFDDPSSAMAADDDPSFRLVDAKPPPRPKFGPRWRFQQRPQLPQRRDEEVEARKREADKDRARRDRLYQLSRSSAFPHGGPLNNPRRDGPAFKSSVEIQPEWTLLDQIPFSTFSKLSFAVPDTPEDLLLSGALQFYDRAFDRLNPKSERRLERFKPRTFFKPTTTDDPVIRRLANADAAAVFATDSILAALMCAPRSVYSWDMVVQRVGNKLFFDKRDGSQLDLPPVNESSPEPLPETKDDVNSAASLALEAAHINQFFAQQVLARGAAAARVEFDEPSPFPDDAAAAVAYRYRRWKLADDLCLVARCEVHAAAESKGQRSFVTLNALNEFDPKLAGGVDWRQKLETQRGAVLANELKNNANKLARWTAQALLAGADMMKLGFVSRVHPRDPFNHAILGVAGYKPREFAAQINLNTLNMWGIVKSIVDLCMKLGEGKYVLVKDPVKPQVRIYEVPPDAFENDYAEEPLPEDEQVQPIAAEDAAAAAAKEDEDEGLTAAAEVKDNAAIKDEAPAAAAAI
ncbi:eukaryotic translation initiation factor 3 subunit D-like [Wolffia australiana]